MEQTGEYTISAPRDEVWAALNDPEVLKRCIDGCQSMEQTSDTEFAAAVKAKIGPVSALFKADLTLMDLDPPNSYTIKASAKGGAAGFGKGTASVSLADQGDDTQLSYAVNANVGGKLAQIGSRLIDSAARKMADDFFARFRDELGAPDAAETHAAEANSAETEEHSDVVEPVSNDADSEYQPSQQWVIWAIMFGVLLLAVVLTL